MPVHRPNAVAARRFRKALASGLVCGAALSGCYTYEPLDHPSPPVGEQVRVELTGAGQDNLFVRRAIDVDDLSGEVVNTAGTDLLLRVRLSPQRLGYGTETLTDTVRVPVVDVREVGVRRLSKDRSLAMAAGGVVAVAGAFALFQARQSSGTDNGGGGGDLFTVIPISSLLRLVGGGR